MLTHKRFSPMASLILSRLRGGSSHSSPEGGYTILESMVAVLIVGILMTAISPIIVYSTATRLQAKRVELAAQAARTYVDWLRSNPLEPTTDNPGGRAPGNKIAYFSDPKTALLSQAAPSGSLNCDGKTGQYCDTARTLFCVSLDGDSDCKSSSMQDMVVQAFRVNNPTPVGVETFTDDGSFGYVLGVRVYRANSFAPGVGTLSRVASSTTTTSGLGNRTAPLVSISTEIPPASQMGAFKNYCYRLDQTRIDCQ